MKKLIKQKLLGIGLIFSAVMSVILSDGDITFAVIGCPLGLLLTLANFAIIED